MSNHIIRKFIDSDRAKIRQICCDTADRGMPIERFFPDREFAADVLSSYYTDYEPSSTFVAICDGELAGYVQGCFDNRRYGLAMLWIIVPKAFVKGLKRGSLFHLEFWRTIAAMILSWRRLFSWRKESFDSHQAHIHIGILPEFRGQHLGQGLIAAILDLAKLEGIHELTASVHDGNVGACRFFESMGFVLVERYPMTMINAGRYEPYNSLLYAKEIN